MSFIYITRVIWTIEFHCANYFILNNNIPLHLGYEKIECLEEYTGVKCLWLECNAFSEIRGLENQTELRCLYLQNNLIKVGGRPIKSDLFYNVAYIFCRKLRI